MGFLCQCTWTAPRGTRINKSLFPANRPSTVNRPTQLRSAPVRLAAQRREARAEEREVARRDGGAPLVAALRLRVLVCHAAAQEHMSGMAPRPLMSGHWGRGGVHVRIVLLTSGGT